MTNGSTNGTKESTPTMRNMHNLENYFSTPIAKIHDPILANTIKPIARNIVNDKNNQTNIWGYNCTYGTPIERDEKLQYFNKWALDQGRLFFKSLGYNVQEIDFKLEVFVSELFENDSHPIHVHPNSKVSGILYLDTPEGSANIRFHDPRPFRNFVSYPKLNDLDYEFVDLPAKQGWCYLWPAWLEHEVLPNHTGDKGRLAIVFNM